jgi:hypothetical protein
MSAAQVFAIIIEKAAVYGPGAVAMVKAIIQSVRGAYPELDERPLTHVSGDLEAAKRAADRLAGR